MLSNRPQAGVVKISVSGQETTLGRGTAEKILVSSLPGRS